MGRDKGLSDVGSSDSRKDIFAAGLAEMGSTASKLESTRDNPGNVKKLGRLAIKQATNRAIMGATALKMANRTLGSKTVDRAGNAIVRGVDKVVDYFTEK